MSKKSKKPKKEKKYWEDMNPAGPSKYFKGPGGTKNFKPAFHDFKPIGSDWEGVRVPTMPPDYGQPKDKPPRKKPKKKGK